MPLAHGHMSLGLSLTPSVWTAAVSRLTLAQQRLGAALAALTGDTAFSFSVIKMTPEVACGPFTAL